MSDSKVVRIKNDTFDELEKFRAMFCEKYSDDVIISEKISSMDFSSLISDCVKMAILFLKQ